MKSEDTTIGKANKYSATKFFDQLLSHVLTNISDLELDGSHSKYRDILSNNNRKKWDDFDKHEFDDITKLTSKDKHGVFIKFKEKIKSKGSPSFGSSNFM